MLVDVEKTKEYLKTEFGIETVEELEEACEKTSDIDIGLFGVDKAALTMGAFGTQVSDALFLMYGMTVPHIKYRLGRLLTMLAQNREFVYKICTDLEKEKVGHLKTVQMTKYPEAKEMRGVMKLTKRVPDPKMGFRLTYESELKDRTEKETLAEWLRRENKWQKERAKAKAKSDTSK